MKFNPIYLLALLMLVLTACGGDGNDKKAEAKPETQIVETLDKLKTAIAENKSVSMQLAGQVDGVDAYGLGKVMHLPETIDAKNVEVKKDGEAIYTHEGDVFNLKKSGDNWLVVLKDEQIAAAIVYQFDKAYINHEWDKAKALANKKSTTAIDMAKSNAEKKGTEKEDIAPIKDVICEIKVIEEAKGDNPMGELSETMGKAIAGESTTDTTKEGPKEIEVAMCKGCCKPGTEEPKEYKVKHEKEGWRVEVTKGCDK